jgi:hypothetical protein
VLAAHIQYGVSTTNITANIDIEVLVMVDITNQHNNIY